MRIIQKNAVAAGLTALLNILFFQLTPVYAQTYKGFSVGQYQGQAYNKTGGSYGKATLDIRAIATDGSVQATLRDSDGLEGEGLLAGAINVNGVMQLTGVMTAPSNGSRWQSALIAVMQNGQIRMGNRLTLGNTVEEETATMAFAGGPAPGNGPVPAAPVAARPSGNMPSGLYYMTRYWVVTKVMEQSVWYFGPDGRFCEGLQYGFSANDIAAHKGDKGTFRMIGNTLDLRYDGGQKPLALPVERYTDGGFGYNMGIFSPVRPFTGAGQVAGSYSGGQFIGNGGNRLINSKSLTLRTDGTFTTASIVTNAPGNYHDIGVTGDSQGRWQWSGWYLALTDNAGHTSRLITFPIGKDLAFIGGILYERK